MTSPTDGGYTAPGMSPTDPNDPRNPYAPRSRARLDALKKGLEGANIDMPTAEEIAAAEGDPVAMQDLLARAKNAQAQIDATRGKSYLTDAGRVVVANPWGAVSDIFVRGNAAKERDAATKSAGELERSRRTASADLAAREVARDRADNINAQLGELDELDRGDAQAEAAERTRLREREQDRSDKSLRDSLDETYRQAGLAQRRKEAEDQKEYREDSLTLDRDRIRAEVGGLNAKAAAAKQQTANAYGTWQTAAGQYLDAHKNAGWGPGAGGNYSLRTGAKANLAPVLKGIFRSAGEGTFTDRDQEMLMEMAPTAFDSDENAAKKLRNIDAIIRAKMGLAGESDDSAPASDDELIGRYQ